METNKINILELKKTELIMLLNSAGLGTVLSTGLIQKDFLSAGYRICGKNMGCIHIFKYAAWLIDELSKENTKKTQRSEDKKEIELKKLHVLINEKNEKIKKLQLDIQIKNQKINVQKEIMRRLRKW